MPHRAAIASVGYALPERVVATAEISQRIKETTGFEITNGLVERLTGVSTRRYRAEDEQSSDLAVRAAAQAIERAGVSKDQVDLLIFAACTQDIIEPATANIVQEKLGIPNAQVFDVKNACNSFLNGLDIADSHMRAGKSRCAVVASGETLSMGVNWNIRSIEELKSHIAALTLGDAGAAVVLEAVPQEEQRGILMTRFHSYGEKWRMATVLGGGSMYHVDSRYFHFVSESASLREAAYQHVPGAVEEVCEAIGWKPLDVDVVCGHQVTKELAHGLAERCGSPIERNVLTITDCGNTGAASIPLALSRAHDRGLLERGKKIMLVGAAAGFSVGVIPVIW